MKRFISLLLALTLLVLLSSCNTQSENWQKSVRFYYPRAEIYYDQTDGVIGSEIQPELDPSDDLTYLMAHYLNGPADDTLYSPFPKGLRIDSIQLSSNTITITFTPHLAALKGFDLTKACVSIAMTCLDLTDADAVSIYASGAILESSKIIHISRGDLYFTDLTLDTDHGGEE